MIFRLSANPTPGRVGGDISAGRVAIVTGVSRRAGIGFAIAQRLLAEGLNLLIHSWAPHDATQPHGADPGGMAAVIEALGGLGPRLDHLEADFEDPAAPGRLVERAVETYGALDVLIANHAHSSAQTLEQLSAGELDRAWAVNARAVVLLVQAFAARHDDARPDGRVVLFTSGQHLGPMAAELPYAISKGAVHQMTASLADALAGRGVTVNTINPGPVDSGWPSEELRELGALSFPGGRWGRPEDIAAVVGWLASSDAAWITGQVINAEGGFRR
jgi:3-oxoacyl-[acyl-carrier protein] reductase